jgi:hypothetical protein
MVKRIVFIGVVLAAGMGLIKDGRILRNAGLTGSCAVAQTLANGEQIEACSSGKLEGAPDLTRNGCTDSGLYGGLVYWRCPAPVVSAP